MTSPQTERFFRHLCRPGLQQLAVSDFDERWSYDRARHRHEYDYAIHILPDNSEAESDLRHYHANLAARDHPYTHAQSVGFAQLPGAQPAAYEFRNDGRRQDGEREQSSEGSGECRKVDMESDARQEERHQEFGDASREIADAPARALGHGEPSEKCSDNRGYAGVDSHQGKREEQAHGKSEVRLSHAQLFVDVRYHASHGVGAPLRHDHGERHGHQR